MANEPDTRHDALLRARWRAALTALAPDARGAAIDEALEAVLARHREPHRAYHGVAHVARVVEDVEQLARESSEADPSEVPLIVVAAVFHDAVYEPRSTTNERDSADLADAVLDALGVPEDDRRTVRRLIEATAGHVGTAASTTVEPAEAILLDADLAVLGADAGAYQGYARGVRREYAHLDRAEWTAGRRAVLQSLLARDRLYRTEAGRRRWEVRARGNLTAELRSLE